MDVSFSPEQQAYRLVVRRWLEDALPANWDWPTFRGPADDDENAEFQKRWEQRLYAAGFAGVAWPKAYGGQGLSLVEHLIVCEELGLRAAPEGINVIGTELVGPVLLAVGTEEQKRHYIPRILKVDDVWCQGFSEPNAGSDLAALKTRAVRNGDEWIISGQKIWTSYAHHADLCIMLARTDASSPKHKGLTLFMVDMKAPGITIRPLVQITGRRDFNETFYDGVRVPDHMRIGAVNAGWDISIGVLGLERATTRMHRQARYMHEFNHLAEIARQPAEDGTAPSDNPHFRQKLADLYTDIEIFRYHNLKTASLVSNGKELSAEASITKLWWSELHQRLADFSIDLLGSRFSAALNRNDEDGSERFADIYLQARAGTIFAGTSQIQRNIIAERLLDLPR
jgi:alkylation response protein AidB-like acyl-CoA dehydrogenase